MKNIILLIILFALLSSNANSQTGWVQQSSGTGYTLNSVFFLDSNIGYTVGDTTIGSLSAYIILKTTNGGLNWINQTPPFPSNLNALKSVFFLDAITGWACGGGNTSNLVFVIKTTNGGANWISQYSGTTSDLNSVSFIGVNTGTVVGVGGTILHTTNGGINWIRQYSGTSSEIYSVYFSAANTGTVVGEYGTILRKSQFHIFLWHSGRSQRPA